MSNPQKFLLRWCFEYSDHKPKKCGMWSHPGVHQTEQAWCQDKTNLLRATIEGKDVITRKIIPLASVSGDDFVNFAWIKASFAAGLKGSGVLPGKIIGLMLVSRDEMVKIYANGAATKEKSPVDYTRMKLAGFGR